MNNKNIIEKLDYALSMLIGIENVDLIYQAKDDNEVQDIILKLGSR